MSQFQLDDVDRGILYILQRNSRNTTAQEIADHVGVSPSTVRNRIDTLETVGVIRGYHPEIDYEAANLPLHVLFVCTVPPTDRESYVERVLDVRGVVNVREMLTGTRNIHVEVVATTTSNVARTADALHNIGLTIESSEILKRQHIQPFNHFFFENIDTEDLPDSK
ncbi:MAG: Lrp/AsnC family transcriptional regulator [Halobacteriota archaeon]